ncbi:MAG TPA: hypothetical protein VN512_04430 [Clostridia bacterium]|nr:hypothetical protein [Clostridia bacterium]
MKYILPILAILFLLTGCATGAAPQTPPAAMESAVPTPEPSPAPVFADGGTHKPTESYKQVFTFLTTANDNYTLNIQSTVFDEARAARLWEAILDD